jgi:hypothetical protein
VRLGPGPRTPPVRTKTPPSSTIWPIEALPLLFGACSFALIHDDDDLVTEADVDRLFREYKEVQATGTGEEAYAAHERFAKAEELYCYRVRVIEDYESRAGPRN